MSGSETVAPVAPAERVIKDSWVARSQQGPSTEISALVENEVAKQIGALRLDLERKVEELRERTVDNRASLIIFSGDLDRVLAGFVLATGAASAGLETSMFFTFWGLSVLKKKAARARRKNLKQRLFSMMTPASSEQLGVSKMNYFGIGARMFRSMMKEKNVSSLEELFAMAKDLGVKMVACGMSMDVMGVEREDLVDGVEYGGVGTFLGEASSSRLQLFI
jgi:peroxiredoxin family protein